MTAAIAEKQTEKEDLLQKIARGRQLLNNYQFTDGDSIRAYLSEAQGIYGKYLSASDACTRPGSKILMILSFLLCALCLAGCGAFAVLQPLGDSSLPLAFAEADCYGNRASDVAANDGPSPRTAPQSARAAC